MIFVKNQVLDREREREKRRRSENRTSVYNVCVYKVGCENKKKSGGFPFIFNRVVGRAKKRL